LAHVAYWHDADASITKGNVRSLGAKQSRGPVLLEAPRLARRDGCQSLTVSAFGQGRRSQAIRAADEFILSHQFHGYPLWPRPHTP
jgi:hypothetical protein